MYIRALFTQAEGADDVLSFPPIIGERYTRRYAPGDPRRRRRKKRPRFQLHRWTNIAARCTYAIVYTRCHVGRCYPHHHLLLSFNLPSPLTEDAQRLFLLLTRTRHTLLLVDANMENVFLLETEKLVEIYFSSSFENDVFGSWPIFISRNRKRSFDSSICA